MGFRFYLCAALDSMKIMVNKIIRLLILVAILALICGPTTVIKRKYFAPGSSHDFNGYIE